ncbi:MAG: tetratricopeptide repeat protein [Anaerolineae bacterium]|nr:tetratricopeptide repeat protein [Anaerolineae bacterium]MDW8170857.1 tetratricopeptide repeat protein [Anaerolineae bacterium]
MKDQQLLGNRYQLHERLGEGGMGVVYRATDRLTSSTVALKRVIIPSGSEGKGVRLALTREFRTLSSLRHPHIIGVLDYGFDDAGQPYFVMPLVEQARDLRQATRQADDRTRVKLLIQLLQALAYLHRRRIVHRDLKPGNVLVTADDAVRVLDFGLAVESELALEISGTMLYIAPEVLQMRGASAASDLYAVGVMAYEIFANRHPFNTDNLTALIGDILTRDPDLSLIPDLDLDQPPSVSLRVVIGRLMEKNPQDRYADAYAVIDDLSLAVGTSSPRESDAIRESFLQAAQFVGRQAEMKALQDALEALWQGVGGRWLVTGEVGVGKSRLLDELRVQALVRGALVLRGQAVAEQGAPFVLWREPLRRLVLTLELDDLQVSILREVLPDISVILGRDVPSAPLLDGAAARQRLTLAIAEAFARFRKPVVLLLEDIHWATGSLDVLQALNRLTNDRPLLIVASYRSDEAPQLAQSLPDMRIIHLERLNRAEVEALASSILGASQVQAPVLELLNHETEGNAYFLVETVRALAEEVGGLERVGSETLPSRVFAGGVAQVLRRRLGRVSERYRHYLNLAAIAGRAIDLALLQGLIGPDLDDWLTTCANVAIFTNWDESWRFAHNKLREVLLSDLPADGRADLHRQVAQAFEAAYPNAPQTYARLADLWREAGDTTREINYAEKAAALNLATGASSEALDLFQRALRGLQVINPQDDFSRMRLLKQLGDTYESLSQYDEALRCYQQSIDLAQSLDNRGNLAAALVGLGDVQTKRGQLAEADATLQLALSLARQQNDQALVAQALSGLGTIDAKRGKVREATALFEEALALRRGLADQRGEAAVLNNLGIVMRFRGQYQAAHDHYQQSLAIRRAIGDRRGMANVLSNLGVVSKVLLGYDAARTYYDEAIAIFKTIGDLRGQAVLLNNRAMLALEENHLQEAETIFHEAANLTRTIGDTRTLAYALDTLGHLALLRQNYETAAQRFDEGLTIYRQIGDKRGLANTLTARTFALRELDRLEEAEADLCEAHVLYTDMEDPLGLIAVQHSRGLNALYAHQPDHARDCFQQALQAGQRTDVLAYLSYALSGFVALFMVRRRTDEALRLLGFIQSRSTEMLTVRAFLGRLHTLLLRDISSAHVATVLAQGQSLTLDQALALAAEA